MRIRSIKPEFWRSDDTASLTDWHHRLIFIGLWSYVDDNGVGRDNAALILADLFPQDPKPDQVLARIQRALVELSNRKMIVRYKAENRDFLFITGWHHQKIDRPSKARYPEPLTSDYDNPIEPSRETIEPSLRARKDQGSGIRDQGIKGTVDQGRGTRIAADWQPNPRLIEWARLECPAVDGRTETAKFIDHFIAKAGKDGVKLDWDAAFRNWMRGAVDRLPTARGRPSINGSTTDQRVNGTLALAAEYAAEANNETRPQIGSR